MVSTGPSEMEANVRGDLFLKVGKTWPTHVYVWIRMSWKLETSREMLGMAWLEHSLCPLQVCAVCTRGKVASLPHDAGEHELRSRSCVASNSTH